MRHFLIFGLVSIFCFGCTEDGLGELSATDTGSALDSDEDTGSDSEPAASCVETITDCDEDIVDGGGALVCNCYDGAQPCADYCAVCGGDPNYPECDDTDSSVDNCSLNIVTAEICDEVDNDCDGETDDGLTCNVPFAADFPSGSAGSWRTAVGSFSAGAAPGLNEASGLVLSRRNPDVFWSHQDNGGDERLFALGPDGTYLGTWDLDVDPARDPEDIAIGPGPISGESYIYFGDIGHNYGIWGCTEAFGTTGDCAGCAPGRNCQARNLKVWRAVEPTVDPDEYVDVTGYPADTITLTFPDSMLTKSQDVETLMIDPADGYAYIVTKRTPFALVFGAPISQAADGDVIELEYITELGFTSATAGDISLDGSLIIIRNYGTAYIWERGAEESIFDALSSPSYDVYGIGETQGEAIAFDLDNSGQFFTTSEGSGDVPIYFYARNL